MSKFQPIMESSFEDIALEQENQANNIIMKINYRHLATFAFIICVPQSWDLA